MKFKKGDIFRNKKIPTIVIRIADADDRLNLYIINFNSSTSFIDVTQDAIEEYYEKVSPVEQELW